MITVARPQRPAPTISIAPLVDCVFLLLIFFLLTSTFSQREAVRIRLPAMATSSAIHKEGTVVVVESDGTISLGGRAVALTDLEAALRKERKRSDRALIVADRQVVFSRVTDVLDAARRAGVVRVAIAARKRAEVSSEEGRTE